MNDSQDNALFHRLNERTMEIQRIRSEILYNTVAFFNTRGFMFIDPPVLHEYIPNRNGGIAIPFFDRHYDLNASNALYISAYATIFEKTFAISPTFRNEKHSANHLGEFRMLECEMCNYDFQQCITLVQNYIEFICEKTADTFGNGIFQERLSSLKNILRFETISYKALIAQLQTGNSAVQYGDDLSDFDLEVSKLLIHPTFVTDYPCPPATWTALPKENGSTSTFNFLLPHGYGELAEGGQRNNDYTLFQKKFEYAGISCLSWYVDAIKVNPCIRSGFGLGIERLVSWVTGVADIRETLLFYREGY